MLHSYCTKSKFKTHTRISVLAAWKRVSQVFCKARKGGKV